jgi:hypothetical protein
MLKNKIGSLVLVIGITSYCCSCSSSSTGGTGGTTGATGGASATGGAGGASATGGAGGASATGGASAAGGSVATGGAGGAVSSGGTSGAGGSTLTLAQACTKNCSLGSGLATCSTTMDVCVQNCQTTFDNTSAVNPSLGRLYTTMMVCIATNPYFATAAGFICAKPNRALNKWSPDGPPDAPSDCETAICLWNCGDPGDSDPYIDLRCTCSSV